ncbi:MAG: InlB B-repeat-containing protein, partial [Verrucomicrobia bacterium]|nr:InlB B-repeat-containing protein [Verrucomicrobiota bacterium]
TAANGSGTDFAAGGSSTWNLAANTTLYAKWTANSYTVTYNTNSATSGTAPSSGSATFGSSFTASTNSGTLARTGYTFAGWNTAANGSGTDFAAGGSSTWNLAANTTLYAKWTADTLNVTYDTQGGSSVTGTTTTTGGTVSTPTTPTRAGFTFNGWFTASSGGSALSFPYTHGETANFTLYAQWTSASLAAPTGLSVTMPSNTTNITLNWSDISGETSYDVQHSTSSTWAGATTITGITAGSTSRTVDVGAAGTYYIRVRGNATATGTWSTTQVVQLRSLANGATAYLAPAGNVTTATVAGIFGASNAAGLAASSADNTATTIMLLNDAGATAHTLFYNNSASQWRGVGTSTTDRASESMPAGKAFMVKNNSGSTDFFILNAEPRTAPLTVSVNANAGQMNLLTPAKSTATALNSLNLTAGGDNTTTGIKRATLARDADVIMIQNGSGRFIPYHFDGTNWRNNRTVISDPSTVTVPAGGAFFIRKGPSSNFNSYTPPNE